LGGKVIKAKRYQELAVVTKEPQEDVNSLMIRLLGGKIGAFAVFDAQMRPGCDFGCLLYRGYP
jgi:hypothetical protein